MSSSTESSTLPFTQLELAEFAHQLTYSIDPAIIAAAQQGDFSGVEFGCIDGRRGGTAGDNVIPVPGGALGMFQDIASALQSDQSTPEHLQQLSDTMLGMLGGKFGFHTDNHATGLSCAGCGHCNGALNNPESYLQSQTAVTYVRDTLLPALANKNIQPVTYSGAHEERGVVISNNLQDGLNSIHDGQQVFVYNAAWHKMFIEQVAVRLPWIDAQSAWHNAQTRLGVTVQKLASHLQIFTL